MNKQELAKKAKEEMTKKAALLITGTVETALVDTKVSENVVSEIKNEESKDLEVNLEEKKEDAKPEEKAPENKIDTKEANKNATESEKSMTIINNLVSKNPGLKIVASESKTGWSFFSGKKRLCKLLKTKRGVTLEINVSLSKEMKEMPEMETISATMAFKKHLGTMKHLYRANDAKHIPAIMKESIAIFKQEMEIAKKQDEAIEEKAANQ